jgi:hypothetical protein
MTFPAVLVMALVGSVCSAGVQEGLAAMDRGDYAGACRHFLPLAEKGDSKAQITIGLMYRDGLGVTRNRKMAYCLFLITHVCGLGSESTQLRANSCLRRIVPEMTKDDLRECLNYTMEYIQAYVVSKGTLTAIPADLKPSTERLALKDKDWWLEGELEFLKDGKTGQSTSAPPSSPSAGSNR